MTHIYMLDGQDENIDALLAAMSFHDAFAYMMYNAIEEALPDIDQVLPPINTKAKAAASTTTATSNEAPTVSFGCRQVTNPINQMWIQGEPSIFLKNEARIVHRSLDAMSCAVRSCCDQANREFQEMAQAMGGEGGDGPPSGDLACGGPTPTSLAVMANEDEMCSRNLILSAKTLVNQGNTGESVSKPGLTMMLTAMDAFLENNDPQGSSESDGGGGSGGGGEEGGFSETQIRNLRMACEMAIKHPMLLYAPGPVYHMMTNAAVLLCHLLNGLHAKCSMMGGDSSNGSSGEEGSNAKVESAMFYETLDAFMSLRKLLNMRRQHLPVRLRCHAIPRPNFGLSKKNTELETPFIDLGETLMCSCRGCQGFVLMGCSPCVAAERSMRSAKIQANELEGDDDINGEYDDLGELNLDDDTLLNLLSRIASN